MNFTQPNPGMVLLCDEQGRIREVLHDSVGGSPRLTPGRSLTQLVEPAGLEKMLNFLAELRRQGAAFDWELNVSLAKKQVSTLHFTGVIVDDGLLILAGDSSQGVKQLYEELMRINNEQLNTLRSTLKEQSQARREEHSIYDKLSRLNNEMANLQREMAKKNIELERLNRLKNQFLGMASHDLRSPLAAIMSYSEFLLEDAADYLRDEHVEFLATIRGSSEFMLSLVDDLLDVSAIEAGRLELDPEPVDLVALVKNNLTLNKVLATRKEIDLKLDSEVKLLPVAVDRNRIEQVLNNLISNAIKFSHPGSQVTVRLAKTEGQALVSVIDRGQGIPTEEQDKLFKPFARISVRSTGGEKSTGLGLMIVRKVIEAHNGQISVDSAPGQGSTFYFKLPLRESAEPAPEAEAADTQSDLRPLRILVAEDNAVNQKMTVLMLEKAGYQAEAVSDGKAVCDALQDQSYDVILMDLHMPEMDGLEASRFIRQHWPDDQQPYIIATTASTQQADIQECLAAGMDDYISKPIQLETLIQKLKEVPTD